MRDYRIESAKHLGNSNEQRLSVVEKMLDFSNMHRESREWEEFESKVRQMIDFSFSPTQKRVIELQSMLNELALRQEDEGLKLQKLTEDVLESLGLGRGITL